MGSNRYVGTQTEKNLLEAFSGESQARNKYTYFASVAKKEGYEQMSALFLKTADNEMYSVHHVAVFNSGNYEKVSESGNKYNGLNVTKFSKRKLSIDRIGFDASGNLFVDGPSTVQQPIPSGTEINGIIPKMSPLNPGYLTKKQNVFQKISKFVDKFKGVKGSL